MPGPLANVNTLVAGIKFDINRLLYMGNGYTLEFLVPDHTETSGYRTLLTLTKNFDRVQAEEGEDANGGSDVIIQVADVGNQLPDIVLKNELLLKLNSVIYLVSGVPDVAFNEAQVYTFYCKVRTLRTTFFNRD